MVGKRRSFELKRGENRAIDTSNKPTHLRRGYHGTMHYPTLPLSRSRLHREGMDIDGDGVIQLACGPQSRFDGRHGLVCIHQDYSVSNDPLSFNRRSLNHSVAKIPRMITSFVMSYFLAANYPAILPVVTTRHHILISARGFLGACCIGHHIELSMFHNICSEGSRNMLYRTYPGLLGSIAPISAPH